MNSLTEQLKKNIGKFENIGFYSVPPFVTRVVGYDKEGQIYEAQAENMEKIKNMQLSILAVIREEMKTRLNFLTRNGTDIPDKLDDSPLASYRLGKIEIFSDLLAYLKEAEEQTKI